MGFFTGKDTMTKVRMYSTLYGSKNITATAAIFNGNDTTIS
jgi:hypothetical protein